MCVSDCVTVCVCVRMLLAHRTLTLHSFKLISNWMLAQVFASFSIKFAAPWMFQLFYPSAIFFFPPVPQLQTHGCQLFGKKKTC